MIGLNPRALESILPDMGDFRVEVASASDYARFLYENPPDNPYSLLPLLEAYRDAFSCEFQLLLITRNGVPVASNGLFVGKKFLQPVVKLMPSRIYDGINFRKLGDSKFQKMEHEKLSVCHALEEFLEKHFSFHQMSLQPGLSDIRAFQWYGARVVPQYTYVADLADDFEEKYTKSLKELLRSAERSGLTTSNCSIDDLISLQQISYERHLRRPPTPSDKMKRLLTGLCSAELLEMKCVRRQNGDVISGLAWLRMKEKSFLFVSGSDVDEGKGAPHLLYHEMLKSEKEQGRSFVDFCGANTPTINLFKSAFGPQLEIYFKIWRANKFVTKIASLVKKI